MINLLTVRILCGGDQAFASTAHCCLFAVIWLVSSLQSGRGHLVDRPGAHWFVYPSSSAWLILISRVRLLKKERHELIVGVTPHVDLDEVTCAMVKVNDVRAVHHLQCRRSFPIRCAVGARLDYEYGPLARSARNDEKPV